MVSAHSDVCVLMPITNLPPPPSKKPNNRAAPRLKDAVLSGDRWRELYFQMVKIMRRMYHECRLVHADLSEYNLLYVYGSGEEIIIIVTVVAIITIHIISSR